MTSSLSHGEILGHPYSLHNRTLVADCTYLEDLDVPDFADRVVRAATLLGAVRIYLLNTSEQVDKRLLTQGFVYSRDKYAIERILQQAKRCDIVEYEPGSLHNTSIIREMLSMCGEAYTVNPSYQHIYLAQDPTNKFSCAFACVSKATHIWKIDVLCSVVQGTGRKLFLHIMHRAQKAGVDLVSITPTNDTVRKLYLSWGVASAGDSKNVAIHFNVTATLAKSRE